MGSLARFRLVAKTSLSDRAIVLKVVRQFLRWFSSLSKIIMSWDLFLIFGTLFENLTWTDLLKHLTINVEFRGSVKIKHCTLNHQKTEREHFHHTQESMGFPIYGFVDIKIAL